MEWLAFDALTALGRGCVKRGRTFAARCPGIRERPSDEASHFRCVDRVGQGARSAGRAFAARCSHPRDAVHVKGPCSHRGAPLGGSARHEAAPVDVAREEHWREARHGIARVPRGTPGRSWLGLTHPMASSRPGAQPRTRCSVARDDEALSVHRVPPPPRGFGEGSLRRATAARRFDAGPWWKPAVRVSWGHPRTRSPDPGSTRMPARRWQPCRPRRPAHPMRHHPRTTRTRGPAGGQRRARPSNGEAPNHVRCFLATANPEPSTRSHRTSFSSATRLTDPDQKPSPRRPRPARHPRASRPRAAHLFHVKRGPANRSDPLRELHRERPPEKPNTLPPRTESAPASSQAGTGSHPQPREFPALTPPPTGPRARGRARPRGRLGWEIDPSSTPVLAA